MAAADRREMGARGGVPLFRLSDIEIRLDFTWFFIFALVLVSLAAGYFPRAHPDLATSSYWAAGLVATLLFFLSVVVHELSHAWMARASGIPVPAITLFLFGGVSQMAEEPDDPATELRVAAVGPLASFALAGLFWAVHAGLARVAPPLVAGVALYLAFINAALGVFNLLPGLPLDGGRILRALVWWRTDSLRGATRTAANFGKGIALGLMLLGGLQIFSGALVGGMWLVLIGLFLRGTAEAGYQNLVILQSLEDVRVSDVAIGDPVTVPPQLPLRELVDEYFLRHGYRAYPVVEAGNVLGLISIEAFRELGEAERNAGIVKEHMIPLAQLESVSPDLPLAKAFERLPSAPGGRLLVLEDGALVGLLTRQGLTRFLEIRQVLEQAKEADPESSSRRPITV